MTLDSIKITEDKSINIKNCEINNIDYYMCGLEETNIRNMTMGCRGHIDGREINVTDWFVHNSLSKDCDFIVKIMPNKKVFLQFKTPEVIKSLIFVTSDKNELDFYNKCIKASFMNSSKGNDESTRILIGDYDNYRVYFYKDIHNINNEYPYCITMIFKGGNYMSEIKIIEECNKALNEY